MTEEKEYCECGAMMTTTYESGDYVVRECSRIVCPLEDDWRMGN